MVRWTTLILFLAVVTVTTDSLRVFPESIRLFYRLYRSVARGGRILRDIAEGAGTVSEAIKSIDDLLDRSVEDPPPVKKNLDVTPTVEITKKTPTADSGTQTKKSGTKKKDSVKPRSDDKIVVTKSVSDDELVTEDDVSKDSSLETSKTTKILADEVVNNTGAISTKEKKKKKKGTVVLPVESSSKVDSATLSSETDKIDHSTCKMSSSASSNDESCPRPTSSEPLESNLPSALTEKSAILEPLEADLPSAPSEKSVTSKLEVNPKPPSLNGCGALELHIKAPNLPVDKMTSCCDAHDSCYIAACKANKRVCDNMLRGCLFSICDDKAIRTALGNLPNYCNAAAKLLFSGTMALSFHQYKEAQAQLKCRA